MRHKKKYWQIILVILITFTACPGQAGPSYAAQPQIAVDDLLVDSNQTGNFEIYKISGGSAQQLTNDTQYDSWWPKASPDGKSFLFYRVPKGVHDNNYAETSLWMANIDGSNTHQIFPSHANNWTINGHAEWSPDGSKLVMFGGASIVITDTKGNILQHVAEGIDPSWSANGRQLIFISCNNYPKCKPADFRIFIINTDGSNRHQFEDRDERANDPYMSPDGKYIAWISNQTFHFLTWNLMIANADGSNVHPLVSDGRINSKPSWASNGLIYFHKTAPFYKKYSVWSIRPDGNGLTWVGQGLPKNSEYPDVIPPNNRIR